MKQEDIDKMFEGRWRMKNYILENIDGKAAKEIAKDFFEAGLALGQRDFVPLEKLETIKSEFPLTPEEVKMWSKINTRFDLWWEMYDLKCGKDKCMKKWEKLSEKEKEACLQATPAYVASTPDKQFRKRPLTYLNQKAWNDEIIIRHNPDQQRQQRLAAAAERIAEYTKDGK